MEDKDNYGSLILGTISILTGWFVPFLGILFGLLGVGLGVIQRDRVSAFGLIVSTAGACIAIIAFGYWWNVNS